MKQYFVVWNIFQRRALSMQDAFGYELTFLAPLVKSKLTKAVDYIVRSFKTLNILIKEQPKVIWIQLPPVPLLYIAHIYRLFRKVHIVVDCHNSMIKPFWLKWPFTKSLLANSSAVLVHNDDVKRQALSLGVQAENLYVLEDRPANISSNEDSNLDDYLHPWILFPSSFGKDEPIEEVISAAALAPEITFVLTGGHSSAKNIHKLENIPKNIVMTGFLPIEKFNTLLCAADAVLGLTKWEGVQLSVCNEALGAEKPMVLSNTALLKELFYMGAVFIDSSDPKSIAEGCRKIVTEKSKYSMQAVQLKGERLEKWTTQAQLVMDGIKK